MATPVYDEITFNYEVLLRFGDTAPNKGKLTGAHLQTITETTKNDVLWNTQMNPPQQLALVDGESGQMLSEVLGGVTASTIIENQALTATLASIQQQFTEAMAAADAQIADLTARLEQALAALAVVQTPESVVAETESQPAE